ncbi:MAG: phosphate ABC transporter permease subunit PstC [Arcanobacterium sp.]|nr:phosphate ABC transporter permease subunit PstC [Arcanobacterium sp.]
MIDTTATTRAAKRAQLADQAGRITVLVCGVLLIFLTVAIGAFLLYKGANTFTVFGHSVKEFLFSAEWAPTQSFDGSETGKVGAAIYIVGSLVTCLLGLAIALPFSIGAAVFITEIAPGAGEKLFRPAVELFLGIPSVVYGWIGLTVLVPFIRDTFHAPMGGYSVLAAGIVLAVMIFPTITTVAADAIRAVPKDYRIGAYGLGSTRWQVIYRVVLPAAKVGIFTGVVLGLARAFGEALAVAMVIGKTRAFASTLLDPTSSLTTAISADMAEAADGSEFNAALWTMGLLLFIISMFFILVIHMISRRRSHG